MFGDYSLDISRSTDDPVSVEPSDGGGHCDCEKCRNLLRNGPYGFTDQDSSVSDRVFHFANMAAKKIGDNHSVSLYAYNEHLAVPTIPLEKNMLVIVAPYSFNETGLSPEQLLQDWSVKAANNPHGPPSLGDYDYGCLSDWYWETPAGSCSWENLLEKNSYLTCSSATA